MSECISGVHKVYQPNADAMPLIFLDATLSTRLPSRKRTVRPRRLPAECLPLLKLAVSPVSALLNLSGPIARISVNVPSIAFAAPFSTLTVGIDVGGVLSAKAQAI